MCLVMDHQKTEKFLKGKRKEITIYKWLNYNPLHRRYQSPYQCAVYQMNVTMKARSESKVQKIAGLTTFEGECIHACTTKKAMIQLIEASFHTMGLEAHVFKITVPRNDIIAFGHRDTIALKKLRINKKHLIAIYDLL